MAENDYSMNEKEIVLDYAIKAIKHHGYIMTNDEHELKILELLEEDGLLIRADKAGDRNPVKGFNDSYTFIAVE